jgi:hypothetical protein
LLFGTRLAILAVVVVVVVVVVDVVNIIHLGGKTVLTCYCCCCAATHALSIHIPSLAKKTTVAPKT